MDTIRKIALYAGSFDPVTFGHQWMFSNAARLFDKLIVAVGQNPNKKTYFTMSERLDMVYDVITELPFNNIEVIELENKFLITEAVSRKVGYIVRGIRNSDDFKYEHNMMQINNAILNDFNIEILPTTVFLTPPIRLSNVSSSLVKSLIGPSGWEYVVENYVPPEVFDKLKQKYYGNNV